MRTSHFVGRILCRRGRANRAARFLLAAIALPAAANGAALSVWEDNANGQAQDCNGAAAGGGYSWPNNNNWSQQRVFGADPCGNLGVMLQPSNWSTAVFPDNGNGGVNYDVLIGAPAPTNLNINATIDTLEVTSAGVLNMLGGNSLTIVNGAMVNNGTVTVNSNVSNSVTILNFSASATLSGAGTLSLNRATNTAQLNSGAGATITHSAGHTIRGLGQINATLVNHGMVLADVAGGTLFLLAGEKTNDSTFKSINSATLNLTGITVNNAGGLILADGGDVALSDVTIHGGMLTSVGASTITASLTNALDNVILTTGSSYLIPGTGTTVVLGGSLVNNGTITVNSNSANSVTFLRFDEDTLLSGTGTVILNRLTNTAQLNTAASKTVTQSAGHTIRGLGQIGAALVNNGLVQADVNLGTLSLIANDKTNNGMMKATGGGTLAISGIAITQGPAGTIVGDGGNITLTDAIIHGGTLASVGLSTISASGTTTLDNVTIVAGSTYNILGSNTTAILGGALTNNGTITVNSNNVNATTFLRFDEDTLLSGAGSVILNRLTNGAQLNTAASKLLTQSAGHTIQGQGQIGASLVNNGLVQANVSGGTLSLITNSKANNATMKATGGGTLAISGIAITQGPAGTIVGDGGNITLTDAIIHGGTLASVGLSTISASGTTTLDNVTIVAGSTYNILGSNTTAILGGALTNNGTITVNSNNVNATTFLRFDEDTLLSGTGTVILNRLTNTAQLNTAAGRSVTQAAGHTIRGQGQINASLVNNGLVQANVNTGTLSLLTNSKSNNAIMKATGGGTLAISGIAITQGPTGTIVGDGGNITLVTATIHGGALTSVGDSTITASGVTMLDNILLTAESTYNILGAETTAIVGGSLVNNGTITINSNNANAATFLRFDDDTLLSGAGTVILNRLTNTAQLNTAVGKTVTQSAAHTIRGLGQIGASLVNDGLVSANIAAQSLTLMTNPKVNHATMRAVNSATLIVSGITVTQNEAGQLLADGGTVNLTGATIVGGELNAANSGAFTVTSTSTLQGTTSNVPINITGADTLNIAGGLLVNNGVVTVNSNVGNATTILSFTSSGSLAGSGLVVLNRISNTSQLTAPAGQSVTQEAGHSIKGIGQINTNFINHGTVSPGLSAGILTINGTFTQADDGQFNVEIGGITAGTLHDRLVVNGTANLDGLLNVSLINDFVPTAAQTFTILTGTAVNGALANATGQVSAGAGHFDVVYDGTSVVLSNFSTTPPANSEWVTDGGGSWPVGASWSAGIPDSANSTASFLGALQSAASATITLDGNRRVGFLNFNNSRSYIIARGTSGTLSINSDTLSTINVLAGSHTISAPVAIQSNTNIDTSSGTQLTLSGAVTLLAARTLTKKGDGTVDISGGLNQATSSVTEVQAGTLRAARIRGGALVIHADATASINPNGGNTGVSKVSRLNIDGDIDAWTGTLDLTDNDLIVQAGAGTRLDVLATATNQIKSARNSNALLWTGYGITSSTAAGRADGLTGLAVILNDNGAGAVIYSSFGGQSVDLNSTLIKYTWNGDTDLNGRIDADDYFRIDSGFASSGALGGYRNGDFDYSGSVDADDYFLIDSGFARQSGTLNAGAIAVPEPGMIGAMGCMMMLLGRRMRRK